MEHNQAIRFQSAERYVAGELDRSERDAFEDHFFDCPECARDLRWELTFIANARAVSRKRALAPADPVLWETWLAWLRPRRALAFSAAANAILALGFGFVLITGAPQAIGPRFIPAYFAPGPARGSDDLQEIAIPPGVAAFVARIPQTGQNYSSYSYAILNASGKRASAGVVSPAAGPAAELYLEVPLQGLARGAYTLEVRGQPGDKIVSRSKFLSSR